MTGLAGQRDGAGAASCQRREASVLLAWSRRPRAPTGARRAAGFTLIEMMVTIAVIGLALGAVFGGSKSLLPQARLEATATEIGDMLVKQRNHALFSRRSLIVEYDLDANTWQVLYPYELDEQNRILGPGETMASSLGTVQESMSLESVDLALDDDDPIVDGKIRLEITPLGYVPAHDVVVVDPEFAEYEALTVRFESGSNGYQILRGRPPRLVLDDAEFR